MKFSACKLLLGFAVPLKKCFVVCNIRAGTIFKQKGSSCKEKKIHVNLISNIFQKRYKNLIKTLLYRFALKLPKFKFPIS